MRRRLLRDQMHKREWSCLGDCLGWLCLGARLDAKHVHWVPTNGPTGLRGRRRNLNGWAWGGCGWRSTGWRSGAWRRVFVGRLDRRLEEGCWRRVFVGRRRRRTRRESFRLRIWCRGLSRRSRNCRGQARRVALRGWRGLRAWRIIDQVYATTAGHGSVNSLELASYLLRVSGCAIRTTRGIIGSMGCFPLRLGRNIGLGRHIPGMIGGLTGDAGRRISVENQLSDDGGIRQGRGG